MTNLEYVTWKLSKFGLSEADLTNLLNEAGITPGDEVAEDKTLIKTALYNHIPWMLAGLQDVSEGGYSIKWNVAGLKAWYSWLAGELGLDDPYATARPKIRDKSNMW